MTTTAKTREVTESSLRGLMSASWARIEHFFFAPASALPLATLRISLAAVLLTQAFLVRGEVLDFFAHDGIVQGPVSRYLAVAGTPHLSSLVTALAPLGVTETTCLYGVCALYVAGLLGMLAGLFTRTSTAVTFLCQWAFMSTGYTSKYGADVFAHVFLFYLLWMPTGAVLSLDGLRREAGGVPQSASESSRWSRSAGFSESAGFSLRVLQLHLCIVYLSSALFKAQGEQWWNGELIWRALTLPDYAQFDVKWLASWPWLAKLLTWSSLAIEFGYAAFIWPRQTRLAWVVATVALHLGIAVFLGLGVFGCMMAVLTATVFGVPDVERRRGRQ